jgi:hypothetical protein
MPHVAIVGCIYDAYDAVNRQVGSKYGHVTCMGREGTRAAVDIADCRLQKIDQSQCFDWKFTNLPPRIAKFKFVRVNQLYCR